MKKELHLGKGKRPFATKAKIQNYYPFPKDRKLRSSTVNTVMFLLC